MRMRWQSLLFIHWPFTVDHLRPLVPREFEIDTFDGNAWVGLIPFTMHDVSPALLPRLPLPELTDFHECNVRTYVRCSGEAGVYFFSLDASSRPGVWAARRFFHLPYYPARMRLERNADRIRYASDRLRGPAATLRCTWRAGADLPTSQPEHLAHFLTERYALFTTGGDGRPRRCRIRHQPWPLREAAVEHLQQTMLEAAGIATPMGEPVLHHADRLQVRAWPLDCLSCLAGK